MHQLSGKELASLAEKWLNGTITPEEEHLFNQWYEQNAGPEIMLETGDDNAEAFRERVLDRIRATVRKEHRTIHGIRWWIPRVAAAIVAVLIVSGTYFWSRQMPEKKVYVAQVHDIAPGSSKAILTLANGQKIILDSAHTGQLASQGNSNVVKLDSGLLTYEAQRGKPKPESEVSYNTLATPRGGQYQLILPDDTKVWLNAASSIRFPTAFVGKERLVEVSGEVYFEVKHDDNMPFKVKAGNAMIEDIGTHFNINDYEDEPYLATTLLEGAVRISEIRGSFTLELTPGQQVQVNRKGQAKLLTDVNTDDVVAWVHGQLSLENVSVKSLMNQLSRWYDVDIKYDGQIPQGKFGGMIDRNVFLSNMLAVLNANGIHARIEGKTIIVSSN